MATLRAGHGQPRVLRRRRPVAGVVAVAMVAAVFGPLVAACSSDTGGLAVPVLWASDAGGERRGGVEQVRVAVGAGDGGFSVDLATEEAQGAGPQWLAASGAAAVVGTLASAVDPRTIDIGFRVTGRIDGPSGGAALTVGVLAAIGGLSLIPGVTMTGTMSPDGTVGRVGLLPTKIRAAADADYTLVLIPAANAGDRDPDTGLGPVALGESLGIEVRPVADLGEAMAAFTGRPVVDGPTMAPPLAPGVAAVAADSAAAMVERLAGALEEAPVGGTEAGPTAGPTGGPAAGANWAAALLEVARAALQDGDLAGAYGAATEGLLDLVRDSAATTATAAAAREGVGPVAARVATEAAGVVAAIDAELDRWGTPDGPTTGAPGAFQLLNLPSAMGWLTYARAAAVASGEAAEGAIAADELGGLAGTIAEQRVAADVMWPDALAAVLAVTDGPDPGGDGPLANGADVFLDGYTDLLVAASEANARYVEAVLAPGAQPGGASPGAPVGPVVRAAEVLADMATGDSPAVVRTSAAMSWWFVTSSVVAGRQAFGLDAFGLGGDVGVPADQATIEASVRNAADVVTAAAGVLAADGVDPSAALWSAAWGQAAADADAANPAATGEVVALGELWFAAVQVLMLQAAAGSSAAPGG